MTAQCQWLAVASDPLSQVITEHPDFAARDHLAVLSQTAALIHWPAIEAHGGEVSIILRRSGPGGDTEWADHLDLLRQLLRQSGKRVTLLALTRDATDALSDEMGQAVIHLAPLPYAFRGDRSLRVSRASGPLQILRDQSDPLPAWPYNLGRLRRVAVMNADDGDADLSDVLQFANGASQAETPHPKRAPVVVVVVPNGFGLGHVTRMLAVARHMKAQHDARVIFWCFSRAAGIISEFGFEVVSRQTARHIGANPDDWQRWETAEFAAVLAQLKPDLVVQDAATFDDFVTEALVRPNVGSARLALVRRGLWQKHILGTNPLTSEDLADMVVEPGDLAAPADQGITRGRATKRSSFATMALAAPVTLTRPEDMLDRKRARKALGLGWGRHCLVTLGGDAFNDWSHLVRQIVNAAEAAGVRLVWARSPLAAPEVEIGANSGVISRSFYPLAPYLAAFDGVVSSAGYNSFHELIQCYDRPVLFAPRQHSALDDQVARARFADTQEWAKQVSTDQADDEPIRSFMAEVRAGRSAPPRPQWRNGAAEIADMLVDLIDARGPQS
ncbi:glycosyltransferase [Jannaschia sp. CCS1]|uniref:glycosyltransferase n=1 Tax=Jannaschia sp. (strain CCS1) TaxID=290400 RepID=UPI000053D891|nr:hypothetical protein [Jannaschia sp. CCS1]ABD56578.1 hypothetical protein Jann_3661 [Jannaschia sp. CCS1]